MANVRFGFAMFKGRRGTFDDNTHRVNIA
jgi:hypothetical protein